MKKIATLLSLIIVTSCTGSKKDNTDSDVSRSEYSREINMVDTMILKEDIFYHEIISNGRLRAVNKSELRFQKSGGELSEIYVANGSYVKKGDKIASLNPYDTKLKLNQAQQQVDRSYIDFVDYLVGFGYSSDTTNIPRDRLQIAYTRSGYLTAMDNLELTKMEANSLSLYAPFSGKIANLKYKTHEQVTDVFCTLIDDGTFEVDFNLLESEIPMIGIGLNIIVSPFNDPEKTYTGRISQINPIVDDKGQINIKAEVKNTDGKLMEGMNVRIVIRSSKSSQLIVPKNAVVIRDNMEVLFRYGPDGKAQWTYVHVLMSNSTHHVVAANKERGAEMNAGDAIIISGNLNLAEGSQVEIRK